MSTKAALEELGFGPCYHQFELGKNPAHGKAWGAAARGEHVDWEELLEDYQATVDWPGCTYYKELMEAFPDAKVLLTVRDPERWYESTLTSIYSLVRVMRDMNEAASASPITPRSPIWDGTFSGRFEDREYAIEVFNRHNEEVERHVPPDRLLVYEVKEGWEPLCEFLSVEVPEGKTFPRLNDAAALHDLPYAKRIRERLAGYDRSRSRVEGQWGGSVALMPIPLPRGLPLKLYDAANLLKKVGPLHLAGQLAKARSYWKG